MTEVKNTSQENVEKKFKDVFGRSPGAFPEGASLEEKVSYIAKGTKALKAMKSKELENKMKDIAKLNKELEKRQRQNDEEIDKLRRSTQELRKEFGTSKRSRLGGNDESPQEARQDTQIAEASVQTDTQLSVNAEVQTPSGPKSQAVGFSSMSITPTREKISDKKPELNKKDNVPQENQKEEGLFSLLKRFVKKVLEKLLGEDERSVENAYNMKGATQRDTSDNKVQQQGKHFDNILSQDRTISKGLEQVATQLENSTITPVNTPGVDKINAGRER